MNRGSLRLRLTIVFSLVFLLAGAAVMYVTLILVRNSMEYTLNLAFSEGLRKPGFGDLADQVSADNASKATIMASMQQNLLFKGSVTLLAVWVLATVAAWFLSGRLLFTVLDATALLLDRAEARGGAPTDNLVVVFTDGEENASRRWDRSRLFRRISDLQDRGWTFVFLGANQDAIATASNLSIAANNAATYVADTAGSRAGQAAFSRKMSALRRSSMDIASVSEKLDVEAPLTQIVSEENRKNRESESTKS